jgi:putative colanic acid biosynthesis glycosyltransferase
MSEISEISKISNCILFVDMPNLGGGTTFFVNSIISRYSPKTTFLVARNFNGKLQLSINNTVLNKTYNSSESVRMLDEIKSKISFIFVNHIIKHKKSFIQKLFKLGKRVITITHDYLLLFKEALITFDEYLTGQFSLQPNVNINQFDGVITQNIGNMFIYHKYMNQKTKDHVYLFGLPDYTKSLQKVVIPKKNKIRVGIMGFISYIKGSEIVKEFIQKTKGTDIELVIFGTLEGSDYLHQYPYKGISNLNRLLTDLKPNLLIETSICPETYSYTLTLGMLTRLPILYYKKPIPCVVSERLSHYSKSHECRTVDEMIKKSLMYNQKYLYTIDEDSFTFGKNWDKLFS